MSKNKKSGIGKSDQQKVKHLLEAGTLNDLIKAKEKTEEFLKYQWDNYSELARQRSLIQDEIRLSLLQKSIPFKFDNWQRTVKYKYGLHPLSTVGSVTFIGGRFNTGKNVNTEFPIFSGLYIAKNKDTALQEQLGQDTIFENSKMTAQNAALTHPSSVVIVSMSGNLDKVFDLRDSKNLSSFVKLIKNFTFSKELINYAKKIGEPIPQIITTNKMLLSTLLERDWRRIPSSYDIPSNSQIFGHLVYSAGIEGIIYPSKFTGEPCLVIYPENFAQTSSYIILDDGLPHPNVPRRLDSTNWRISKLEPRELLNLTPQYEEEKNTVLVD